MVGCTPVSYPSGLATVLQFCQQSWWSSSLLSTGIYGLMSIPPPNTCESAGHSVKEDIHSHYTLLGIFAHLQWMLWLTFMGEAITTFYPPQGSLAVTPSGSRLDWGGAGTPILCLVDAVHKGTPASDAMRRSWLWCRMHEFPCWGFTSCKGMSVMICCITSWGLPSHLSLIFLFPRRVSALTRMRLPGLKPMSPILQS